MDLWQAPLSRIVEPEPAGGMAALDLTRYNSLRRQISRVDRQPRLA